MLAEAPSQGLGKYFQMFFRSNSVSLKKLCGLLHGEEREFNGFASGWKKKKATEQVSVWGSSHRWDLFTADEYQQRLFGV
jgi:hypothetical protein